MLHIAAGLSLPIKAVTLAWSRCYIQRLRSRQLIEVIGRGELRASEELFA